MPVRIWDNANACVSASGYGPEEETCVFELTYNYGQDKYDNFKGDGYGQVAMSSESSPMTCSAVLRKAAQCMEGSLQCSFLTMAGSA